MHATPPMLLLELEDHVSNYSVSCVQSRVSLQGTRIGNSRSHLKNRWKWHSQHQGCFVEFCVTQLEYGRKLFVWSELLWLFFVRSRIKIYPWDCIWGDYRVVCVIGVKVYNTTGNDDDWNIEPIAGVIDGCKAKRFDEIWGTSALPITSFNKGL